MHDPGTSASRSDLMSRRRHVAASCSAQMTPHWQLRCGDVRRLSAPGCLAGGAERHVAVAGYGDRLASPGGTVDGAHALLETLAAAGVEVCFANPGTTELPLVRALEATPGVRAILGLFEGVCTGAADGYGRMIGRPAATLLHLGPGLANGLANLHNARRT